MSFSVRFDSEKNIVYVTADGTAKLEDFDRALEIMTTSEEYPPNTPAVWDLRSVDFSNFDRELILDIIRVRERYAERDNAKVAVVADSAVGFGMSRMYELNTAVRPNPQNVRTFRDLESAEQWLLAPENSA